jgi:two-component system phosphate regulon sensor histidine kinase PhoR
VEDIELLNSVAALAGAALSRIDLTEDLAEEKMRAERLNELNELKTAFVSAVTHDLKTPLTSIKLFTEMLETAYGPDDKNAREYLGIISGESDRLRALIDNVLDHTRIERGVMNYNFAPVDLNEIVEVVLDRLDYLLTMQGFEVKFDRYEYELLINADAALMDSVVTNLISNAMKYSSEEKQVLVSTTLQAQEAILTIADRGIGISQVDLPNIFQPFYRCATHSALQTHGTGLGLSNVQHIVTAHHGKTTVQSVLGIGTRFTLTFPLLVHHEQDIDH